MKEEKEVICETLEDLEDLIKSKRNNVPKWMLDFKKELKRRFNWNDQERKKFYITQWNHYFGGRK